MWTTLYLQSTDPERKTPLSAMAAPMLFSILFHTAVYAAFVNLVSYVFMGKPLTLVVNTRLTVALLAIMVVGYAGRLYHVQEIFAAYGFDVVKTKEHLDRMYITWFFLA
jgi:hypothetical protein